MFQPIDPWLPRALATLARYALQMLGVVLVAMLLTLMSPDLPEASRWRWLNLAPTLLGFPLAFFVFTLSRSWTKTGMWIWVLPTYALLHDVLLVGTYRPLSSRLYLQFLGNDPVGQLFITSPALTMISYSFGMFVAKRLFGRDPESVSD